MRRNRIAAGVLASMAVLASIVPARGESVPAIDAPFVPDQVLVQFHASVGADAREATLGTIGGRTVASMPAIGWQVARVPARLGAPAALARLARDPAVATAEPNLTGRIALTPNDRCFTGCVQGARQWNLQAVNALAGWDVVPGRFYTAAEKQALPQVKVAVLDTKIDVALADWANKSSTSIPAAHDAANGGQLGMADAADIVPEGQQPGIASYHGSFVAGILGAAADNGTAIAGLGYRATIVPVTVVDGNGVTNAGWLAAGIEHAADVGARVINLSLGMTEASQAVQDAIYYATDKGALVIAAAGNGGSDRPFYPAWHDRVMAVTAADEADRPAACSNFSPQTSVAAPGEGIVSLDPSRRDQISVAPCGTSTAAPHVSALAALLFAQDPTRSPAQVRGIIEGSADDDRFLPGVDQRYGYGRINVERALRFGVTPVVDRVIASIPKNTGGPSTISAVASTVAPATVTGAELFIDAIGPPGTGTPLSPVDGSFDGRIEQLTATVSVPLSMETGVHRVYVRASDGSGWGAASAGVLLVDRTPPRLADVTVSPVAVSLLGQPMRISFRVSDDLSTRGTYTVTAARTLLGVSEVVYESEPKEIGLPASETAIWRPDAVEAGPYEITVTVIDEGGNPASASVTALVV